MEQCLPPDSAGQPIRPPQDLGVALSALSVVCHHSLPQMSSQSFTSLLKSQLCSFFLDRVNSPLFHPYGSEVRNHEASSKVTQMPLCTVFLSNCHKLATRYPSSSADIIIIILKLTLANNELLLQ